MATSDLESVGIKSLLELLETGYALISKSPTKKVFPVEHFGADPLAENSPRACQRAHNFLKAPLRGGEAIRAIAREKSPPNSEKNGFEPVFEPGV